MSEYELALQELMAKLKGGFSQSMGNVNNNVTGVMDAVGKRGLNTKNESSFLSNLMGGGAETPAAAQELEHAVIKDTDIRNTAAEREALIGVGDRGLNTKAESNFLSSSFLNNNPIQNLGIGARGLDTPAERQFLENSFAANPLNGIGARGLDTPAERQFLENIFPSNPVLMPGRTPTIPEGVATGMHRMPDGTMMSDANMNYLGSGEPNRNAPVIDPQEFNKQFALLGDLEKSKVEEIMANMTEQQKIDFAAGLTGAPLGGYAVQDEMLDYTRNQRNY
mgnify:CR=1 FL=1|tara:strand:+ start:3122 stop:3958 length:837 start_codon:yes stop_codon:yes gene_type:complete